MTLQPRTYAVLPDIVTGYPLDDVWAVLKPVARTNLVANPSLETNVTGWAAFGSTAVLDRVTTQQYHGLYSGQVSSITIGDSVGYNGVALVSGTTYAVQIKFYSPSGGGATYDLQVQTTGGVVLSTKRFTASGRWQWIWLYYTETGTATRRIHVVTVNSAVNFYVDGLDAQAIAAGETVSTYIDGDQQGLVPNQFPVPYGWNGTPHASTSYRTGQTRAGGMVIPFKNYNWFLTAIVGLGLALPQNVATEYARDRKSVV